VVDSRLTASGYALQFNRSLNAEVLNLFSTKANGSTPPDITLVGSRGSVAGSLVWNEQTQTLTFIKNGGVLAPDTYTLTLESRSDGVSATDGTLLDGDRNGTTGDNFVQQFTVPTPAQRILSVPDLAQAPGQNIDLPIRIDNAANVSSVALTLIYDPSLLNIADVSLAPTLPSSWQIVAETLEPGRLSLVLSGSPLAPGTTNLDLVSLQANIPPDAIYGDSQVLEFGAIALNNGALSVLGDAALQQVALLGDTSGNQVLDSSDAAFIARVTTGLDSGFTPFSLVNPAIIGDVSGNGSLSSFDAALVSGSLPPLNSALAQLI
jgi:hypothetical protein